MNIGVGAALKRHRELKGLSIASIAKKTKIPVDKLIAIEESNEAALKKIPEAVIVGFVRIYCHEVGIDYDVLIDETSPTEEPAPESSPPDTQTTSRGQRRQLSILAVAFGYLVSIYCIFAMAGAVPGFTGIAYRSAAPTSKTLVLRLVAKGANYIKLRRDGGDEETIILRYGEDKLFSAGRSFELFVNTPKDIDIYLDGKPVLFSAYQSYLHLVLP